MTSSELGDVYSGVRKAVESYDQLNYQQLLKKDVAAYSCLVWLIILFVY